MVIFPMRLGSTPRECVACHSPLVCIHSQKRYILSPLFATRLPRVEARGTDSASRKAFPCHSYENTFGRLSTVDGQLSPKSFRSHSYEKCTCKSFISHSYKITELKVPSNHTLTGKGRGRVANPMRFACGTSGNQFGALKGRRHRTGGGAGLKPDGEINWPLQRSCWNVLLPTSNPPPGGAIDANG